MQKVLKKFLMLEPKYFSLVNLLVYTVNKAEVLNVECVCCQV